MRQVESYKILTAAGMPSLSTAVNAAIKDGWQPLGGLAVDIVGYYQAMVKYQESLTGLGGVV